VQTAANAAVPKNTHPALMTTIHSSPPGGSGTSQALLSSPALIAVLVAAVLAVLPMELTVVSIAVSIAAVKVTVWHVLQLTAAAVVIAMML